MKVKFNRKQFQKRNTILTLIAAVSAGILYSISKIRGINLEGVFLYALLILVVLSMSFQLYYFSKVSSWNESHGCMELTGELLIFTGEPDSMQFRLNQIKNISLQGDYVHIETNYSDNTIPVNIACLNSKKVSRLIEHVRDKVVKT